MRIAAFVWDPNPALFNIDLPFLHRPILWYGVLFALAFFLGYFLFVFQLKRFYLGQGMEGASALAKRAADALIPYAILGAVIGGRLFDVAFYQEWSYVLAHPLSIVQVWNGGLSSHGGALGLILALWLFAKRHGKSFGLRFLTLLDLLVIPACLGAVLIRLGNFINQEIVGTPTSLPWGVLFVHPADGSSPIPRHPVQLYEALVYLFLFVVSFCFLARRPVRYGTGRLLGWFLFLAFLSRFFLEYVKLEQSAYWDASHQLTMGQTLSLPFLCLGVALLCCAPTLYHLRTPSRRRQ